MPVEMRRKNSINRSSEAFRNSPHFLVNSRAGSKGLAFCVSLVDPMTAKKCCECELPLCPHPRFSDTDPAGTNWPEADGFCNECRKNRPAAKIEMAKTELDLK